MDVLFSTILSDLCTRSASFLITKYFQQQQPGIDTILQRLERVVLRIDTVVEEAEGRSITNQGMLRQLMMLRRGMYRGHYILDALRFQAIDDGGEDEDDDDDDDDGGPSHSSSVLSKFNPTKRLRFSSTGSGSSSREALLFGTSSNIQQELQRVVDTLEDTMTGTKEFLLFLESYPRILRQPYGAYLLLENCMFGRQMERHRILNFLLCSSANPDLDVLPIVGPPRVGKTTLVENVCKDVSVRDHFSMILFFPEASLRDEGVINLKGNKINGLVKHQNRASHNRLLIIVEIAEDINEETWRRLRSSITCMTPCAGSKVLITSRSNRIVKLGTSETMRLDYLSPEAYWHFFKSIAFGSTNPDDQPKLATIAMEIALEQKQCFTGAHLVAGILRDNFNYQFWRTILERVRACKQAHLLMFEKHPNLRMREDEPVYYWRLARSCGYFMMFDYHESESSKEVPKISGRDILLGCTLPRGEFEAIAWKSRIPPYYNYTISCKVQSPEPNVGRKKRVHQDKGHFI